MSVNTTMWKSRPVLLYKTLNLHWIQETLLAIYRVFIREKNCWEYYFFLHAPEATETKGIKIFNQKTENRQTVYSLMVQFSRLKLNNIVERGFFSFVWKWSCVRPLNQRLNKWISFSIKKKNIVTLFFECWFSVKNDRFRFSL